MIAKPVRWPVIATALTGLLAAAGCISPPPPAPRAAGLDVVGAFATMGANKAEPVDDWWTAFGDDHLVELVEAALANNAALDAASANVRAAEAIAAGARLNASPSTSTFASGDIGRAARDGADITVTASAGLGASWEIDAFGRIRAQIQAAEFDTEAARQARRDVAVIVASETALAYADLRGAERRLDVARRNAEAQKESLDLLETLRNNGRANQLDFERSEAQYRTTLASLPRLQATEEAAISRLAALTGLPANAPGDGLLSLLSEVRDIPEHSGPLLAGSPETLLRRRPDIRQAEAVLARRLALGDVARAQLFPTLVINADLQTVFDDTDNSFSGDRIGFGLGPSIQWAGPDLRRVRANIDANDALSEAAIATYEQTVLNALSEVEIALTTYVRELDRRDNLVKASQSARKALELARLRFEEGLDDSLDVLDAQRTLLDTQDRLAESRLQATRLAILAYRSLGGMWPDEILARSGQNSALD